MIIVIECKNHAGEEIKYDFLNINVNDLSVKSYIIKEVNNLLFEENDLLNHISDIGECTRILQCKENDDIYCYYIDIIQKLKNELEVCRFKRNKLNIILSSKEIVVNIDYHQLLPFPCDINFSLKANYISNIEKLNNEIKELEDLKVKINKHKDLLGYFNPNISYVCTIHRCDENIEKYKNELQNFRNMFGKLFCDIDESDEDEDE